MNPIEPPIAENYHDIVFSQQRHQPAQDPVGILLVECRLAGGGNGFNDSFGTKPFLHWNLVEPCYLRAFGEAMEPPMVTASKLEQEHLRELESQRRHLSRLLVAAMLVSRKVEQFAKKRLVAVESVKHYLRTLDAQQNQSARAIV